MTDNEITTLENLIHSDKLTMDESTQQLRMQVYAATTSMIEVIDAVDPFCMLDGTRFDLRQFLRNHQNMMLQLIDAASDRARSMRAFDA